MIPFIGFAPDVDPVTPGVITACDDLLPTVRGFQAMPSLVTSGADALAATCYGIAQVTALDGTSRVVAGTDTKLYELSSTTWTDRSRGGDYTTGGKVWRFCQFGNTTLAANGIDVLQTSSGTTFANIASSPIAKCIDAAAGFVMVGNTDATTDTWKCSAFQDASDWSTSVTTQCTTGRIVDAPGPIQAVRSLGSDFVLYKDRAMFLARYVGAPSVFSFQQIPGEIGCASQEAVVNLTTEHIFIGYEDIYRFDGTRPVSIGGPLKKWFFGNLNKSLRTQIKGLHDRNASRVWFFYPSGNSLTNDAAIVYNYATGQWGYCTVGVEAAVEYLTGGITYATIGNYFATYADIPTNITYDSSFWTATTLSPAVVDTSHTLDSISGTSAGCSLTTGDYGDDSQYSLLSRARPRLITSPTSGTATNYSRAVLGDSLTTGTTPTLSDGRYDFTTSARWHRLKYDFVGDVEIAGHDLYLVKEGTE